MILVDTSVWIEYLRKSGSPENRRLKQLIAEERDLAITEVVAMEILAGASSDEEYESLRRFLYRYELLKLDGVTDYELAADLFRQCRKEGETPRKLTDCLVAAVAIRDGVELLHRDRDFEVIARHTPLKLA